MSIVPKTIHSVRLALGQNLRKKGSWENCRFHKFQDALDRVDECATDLECNVSITLERDATFAFFGYGRTIATWIYGDEEDDLRLRNVDRPPKIKKRYLRKEKAWKSVFWRG